MHLETYNARSTRPSGGKKRNTLQNVPKYSEYTRPNTFQMHSEYTGTVTFTRDPINVPDKFSYINVSPISAHYPNIHTLLELRFA
jgi:hypothetical protein